MPSAPPGTLTPSWMDEQTAIDAAERSKPDLIEEIDPPIDKVVNFERKDGSKIQLEFNADQLDFLELTIRKRLARASRKLDLVFQELERIASLKAAA